MIELIEGLPEAVASRLVKLAGWSIPGELAAP
jgi:hypothetical protein